MIDHVGLRVSDLAASAAFYANALAPLGYRRLMNHDFGVGLGADGKPDLWLYPGDPPDASIHIALAASDRATVDAFPGKSARNTARLGSRRVRYLEDLDLVWW